MQPGRGDRERVGQEPDDGVGVQQLGHAVGGAAIALEIEPALLAVARRDQDRTPVRHHLVEDRQRIGGRDTGSLTVVHGARHADERDALDTGIAQVGEPLPQRRLVEECGHLGAQAVDAGQFGLDHRPEVQDIHLGLHLDGAITVLLDHPGHHDVPDAALQPGCRGAFEHLVRLFERLLAAQLQVRRDKFERDGVQCHGNLLTTLLSRAPGDDAQVCGDVAVNDVLHTVATPRDGF